MRQDRAWHACPAEEAVRAFGGKTTGLTDAQARAAFEEFGPNALPEPPRRGPLLRFLRQFHNVLIYVLLASAAVTMALGHTTDSLVIMAVVLANAVIGVIQEGRAENAMSAIRKILAPQGTVIRDGMRQEIDGTQIVPGDVVLLSAGDRVPADIRLLNSDVLSIQEAILTGESLAVEKHVDAVPEDQPLGERSSMAFSGTLVVRGQGTGVVVATGNKSEIGRISGLLAHVDQLRTPLLAQMDEFAKWLTVLILVLGALLFAYGTVLQHLEPQLLFMAIVGLSVAAIPEGLPAVLTITLAIGVQAMARRNAIVRRLPAIETLGSVSVICTDKTGTLTINEMQATSLAIGETRYGLTGHGYAPEGTPYREDARDDPLTDKETAALQGLARAAALCNDAEIYPDTETDHPIWRVQGDPMEGALLAMAAKCGVRDLDWRRLAVVPFDARHRFMAVLHEDPGSDAPLVSVKGAPERILAMCSHQVAADGEPEPLDDLQWHRRADNLANRGQRVLALAERRMPAGTQELAPADVQENLTLVGLVGLMDPPRPEAVEAVARCRSAGIEVKMITGDHPGTAAAIGRQIGLAKPANVLTGADLDAMSDGDLKAAVLETDIFARTSPEDKLRLVIALQAHGLTVAMTGDGVNDAPALKRADAGIAMGQKGSEAAKEASDLVLADDNFRSIADAVREGRTVYDNITKVIGWTLPTSTGEALTIVAAILFGLTLPVTPIQILWINLVTAATLGIALAFEPGEPGTMDRPPRRRGTPLLTPLLAWHISFVSALYMAAVFSMFVYAREQGYSVALAQTIAVNTLVVLEVFQLFFVRTMHGPSLTIQTFRGTRPVWIAVGVVAVGQAAITYVPAMQVIFGTEAVPPREAALILALGVALFVILETEKRLRTAAMGSARSLD
ncbi:MAG: cation-transporting P-type ATPase [Roseibium sp.]|nr:cation-transporting P-type ATPase [Roseibium sp.]